MQIVVSHLTRMQPGYICVAGLDRKTGAHVRPVLNRRLPVNLLKSQGGPFEIGGLVDLGGVKHVGHRPEVEDYLFDASQTRLLKRLDSTEFWKLLSSSTAPDLTKIFGADLEPQGNGCAVVPGKGSASLGCLAIDRATLGVDPWQKIRLRFSSGKFQIELSVTDIRLVDSDFKTPNEKNIQKASSKLAKKVPAIICIGLARAWQKPGDDRQRHWLQVNNIHFSDDPLGLKLP